MALAQSCDSSSQDVALLIVWGFDYKQSITPQTLTTLTLLIATSNPNEKDKLIGLVLLLLNTENQQGN
jgi:hypothetical protein